MDRGKQDRDGYEDREEHGVEVEVGDRYESRVKRWINMRIEMNMGDRNEHEDRDEHGPYRDESGNRGGYEDGWGIDGCVTKMMKEMNEDIFESGN